MNSRSIVFGLVLLVLIAGGAVFFSMSTNSAQSAPEDAPLGSLPETNGMSPSDSAMTQESIETEGAMMQEKDGATVDGETMKKEGAEAMSHGGSYETYAPEKIARASQGDVVLFFRAGWCPTCKAVDSDIRSHLSSIPATVTILDVNYDTETALKQKYGVTYQHTFVQVDAQGNLIAKWSGSPTLASLLQNVR